MRYFLKTSIGLILLLLFIIGCERIPDGIITPKINSFQVTTVTAPDTFNFSSSDSTLFTSLKLHGSVIPVKDPLGYLQNAKTLKTLVAIKLKDLQQRDSSGMKVATANGYVEMHQAFSSGNYNLVFQTIDPETQIATIVAIRKFYYNNNNENFPPKIENLQMYYVNELPALRDSVDTGLNTIFSIKVSDKNGLNNISKVSFDLFRPNKSKAGNFIMFDDGDAGHGDAVAGDGIYSLENSFSPTSSVGFWKFVFSAVDNGDSTSNIITHNLYVK